MKYQAITIDTQVVYANGRHLDRGNIALLEQFRDGPIKFVLSEIVLRELVSLFEDKAKAPREALEKTIKDGDHNGQLTKTQKIQLESILAEMAIPKEHAKSQLKDFIAKTNAYIISAESAPMKPLLDAYFGATPPFSIKGKKNEFPDAISLLALENWAKTENTHVLAVSNDGDWKSFADKSDWIDCYDSVTSAVKVLLVGVESTEIEGRQVLQYLIDNDPPELRADLEKFLRNATENENPHLEFTTDMQATEDYSSLTLLEFDFLHEDAGEIDISIVRVTESGFVMRVPVELKVNVEAEIGFFIHDSVDGDDVPIGSPTVEREITIDAYVLIHCSRYNETEETSVDYEISEVELIEFPSSIDIGYVEYSLAGDDPDYDPDDWIQRVEESQSNEPIGEHTEIDFPF